MFSYKIKKGEESLFFTRLIVEMKKKTVRAPSGCVRILVFRGSIRHGSMISIVHLLAAGSAIWPQLQSNAWTGSDPADRNQRNQ